MPPFWSAAVVAQACQITTYGYNVEANWPVVFRVAGLYGLQEREIMACLCGVIGHETAHRWAAIHEFGTNFSRYGYAPSGQDYGGRGFIQTTWEGNYTRVQNYLHDHFGRVVDLVNNPDLLLGDSELAAHAACIYWVTHASGILVNYSRQLNCPEVIHYVWGSLWPGNKDYEQYLRELNYAVSYLMAR